MRPRQIASIFFVLLALLGGRFAQAAEWSVHEQNLMGLAGHIQAVEKEIAALVHQSAFISDPVKKNALLVEIEALEEELAAENEKMAAELRHVRYQHPERGQDFSLTMPQGFGESLPEHRGASSLLEELSREAMALVRRAYGASFEGPVQALRSPSSEVEKELAPPRWVLEQ